MWQNRKYIGRYSWEHTSVLPQSNYFNAEIIATPKLNASLFFRIILFLVLTLTMSCGKSYDLGDQPAEEIEFSGSDPGWNSGISHLINRKCANCHVAKSERSKFVPSNTPMTVNTLGEESYFALQKNADLIFDRVFQNVERPMPPDFATPFNDREKTFLKNWLTARVSKIADFCSTNSESPIDGTSALNIISKDCSSCHDGVGAVSFSKTAYLKEYQRSILRHLSGGTMPPSDASYRLSESGRKLLGFVCSL
ncbi:MAG: hypothetical protein NT027_11675 [Proteobacteria bacterium]|nr:hypothetical protein [Pseudomonadota bacterium]